MCKSIKHLVVKLYMKKRGGFFLVGPNWPINRIIPSGKDWAHLARSATARVFIQSVRAQESLQLAPSRFSYTKIYNLNDEQFNQNEHDMETW